MKLLEYDIAPEVRSFSTTREGGFSEGNYGSFNANSYCGDNIEAVKKNRQLLADELGISLDNLIFTHQIHSTSIRLVNDNFLKMNKAERSNMLEGVDALITDKTGVCLCISTADCVPIVLYDTKLHVAACVHAGWRGTLQRIAETAVELMNKNYACQPENIKAVLGPSISLESFEVGDEVFSLFQEAGFDIDKIARHYLAPEEQMRWHIDLWECNRLQLMNEGVPAENIQISGICTFKNSDQFFSARKLGIKSGRIITGIMIK